MNQGLLFWGLVSELGNHESNLRNVLIAWNKAHLISVGVEEISIVS